MTKTQTATAQTVKTKKVLAEVTPEEMKAYQEAELKTQLLKSKYGIGGEHFSTIPTLKDKKNNPWVVEEFQLNNLKKPTAQNLPEWTKNGTIQILPIIKGDKAHHTIIITPNKQLKMEYWNLEKETEKPFLTYTNYEKAGTITLNSKNYIITNIYTNKNKAFSQAKLLAQFFNLGTTFKELELQKENGTDYLEMDYQDGKYFFNLISSNTHKPTGKTFKNLDEYMGKTQNKKTEFNFSELI